MVTVPGYYSGDSDIIGFTGIAEVALGEVEAHAPAAGFTIEGYMWLSDDGCGYSPLTCFAYGDAYYRPEGGGEGSMIHTDGMDFLSCITPDMRSYEGMMTAFPQVGRLFEPVLLEDTEIVRIDVYEITSLSPVALDISLEELYNIASLENASDELVDLILGYSRGCVLVDIVVAHRGDYVSELDEYEVEAYHCGSIIGCGF